MSDKLSQDNLMFELVVGKKDGSIDNAAIPVRWCLTEELLEHIQISEYISPQVLIQVIYPSIRDYYDIKEERFLFPLDQFIAYVPLSSPGKVIINAHIVGITEGELKCYQRAFVYKRLGEYDNTELHSRTTLLVRSESIEEIIEVDMISSTMGYELVIPAALFGKKPPSWMWDLVNRYQDTNVADQCSLRRRYMLFPFKLILICFEAILRMTGIISQYIVLWLIGFKHIETLYLKHPLTYGWNCYIHYGINGKHVFQKNIPIMHNSLDVCRYCISSAFYLAYRLPIIPIFTGWLTYMFLPEMNWMWTLFWVFMYPTIILIAILFTLLVVVLLSYSVKMVIELISYNHFGATILNIISSPFRWLDKLTTRFVMWLEDIENTRNKVKLLKSKKYLTCNNDPHSVTASVDAISFRDRTIWLIYTDIKNKVCKPLSR